MEVARWKSVTRAAEMLNLTQPAVSRTLRDLEAVCGQSLLEKAGRGIRLSAHGKVFLKYASHSLSQARDGLRVLSQDGDNGPALRIGALPTVSAALVPQAVAQFRTTGFTNGLTIRTGENQVLLDQLRNGHLDLVIGRLPAPENMIGLGFDPLFKEHVVATVSASHPLAGRSRIARDMCESYPVLIPDEGSIIRPFVERLFFEHGLDIPSDAINTVSDSFGKAFTHAYNAIWFISAGVIRHELDTGTFVSLPLDTTSTLGPVGLCTRRDQEQEPTAVQFCEVLRDLCRVMPTT